MPAAMVKVPLSSLHLWDKNPRIIKDKRFDALCQSITEDPEFMELRPVLATKDGRIYAGNMRYRAAQKLGWTEIPAIITDIPEKLANERAIKDNNEFGEWNNDELATLLDEMEKAGTDISLLGLDDSIQKIIDQLNEQEIVEDEVPEVPEEAKTKLGDLWILGTHRLLCGDATKIDDVEKLMGGEKADMVFTDPPYGISIVSSEQKVGGDKAFGKVGTIHKGMKSKPIIEANTYAPIIGDETTQTAIDAYNLCAALKIPVMIFWGGNYYASALPDSSCWIIWDKDNGESFFADAEIAWTNQKTAVRIFKHTWNGLIKESERGEKRVHPTQKPVALAAWCFKTYGTEDDAVLDLFGGSGSTLIACEQTKRKCYMMELSESYVRVIIDRWEKLTGSKAVLQ